VNSKQAKRLRRNIRKALLAVGERKAVDTDTVYIRGLVDSQRFDTTVNGELQEGKAIQVRVEPNTSRGIYLRVKTNVQANRNTKRRRVLPGIQLRPTEAPGALEHSGAESLQRQHKDVPVL
jgi:hypothetical protein